MDGFRTEFRASLGDGMDMGTEAKGVTKSNSRRRDWPKILANE